MRGKSVGGIGGAMDAKTTATILRVIERAPLWLRHDLEAKDAAVRRRAEEALAAMIADGLANEGVAHTKE